MLLITGATGLVGSHVAERARDLGLRVRALVRSDSDAKLLDLWGIEKVEGDLTDPASLARAVAGATQIVHCAAMIGDWGPVEDYRMTNVHGLEHLLKAVDSAGSLRHFVHVSSLGIYEGRDHYGTSETAEAGSAHTDGYTLSKVEAEALVLQHVRERKVPGTIIRPGFVYGPRDRSFLPMLLAQLKLGHVKYFGSGEQLMNNTFVGNLVDAIYDVLDKPQTVGEIYNVTDGELVSKRDFISAVAINAGYEIPRLAVPLGVARMLTTFSEGLYRVLGKNEAPPLSQARFKFLGQNLDFSIDKARRELGYQPRVSFAEGMRQTVEWFRHEGKL